MKISKIVEWSGLQEFQKPLSAKCVIQAYGSGLYLRGYQTVKTPEGGKYQEK